MGSMLLQYPDYPRLHTVLLRTIQRNELLQQTLAFSRLVKLRFLGDLGHAATGQMPTQQFPSVKINEQGQGTPGRTASPDGVQVGSPAKPPRLITE